MKWSVGRSFLLAAIPVLFVTACSIVLGERQAEAQRRGGTYVKAITAIRIENGQLIYTTIEGTLPVSIQMSSKEYKVPLK